MATPGTKPLVSSAFQMPLHAMYYRTLGRCSVIGCLLIYHRDVADQPHHSDHRLYLRLLASLFSAFSTLQTACALVLESSSECMRMRGQPMDAFLWARAR